MNGYRNIAAVVAALTIMQVGSSALFVGVPLLLQADGASAVEVGVVVAFYSIGFLCGAVYAPRLLSQVGHIRTFAAGAGIVAAATLALYESTAVAHWALLRLISGAGVATILTSGEAWVAGVAPTERRGALVAFYLVCVRAGLIVGPFLIVGAGLGAGAGAAGPLMIAAGAFALCLVPVALTRRAPPAAPPDRMAGPMVLWRTAPAAFYAALSSGLVNGSVPNLIAVYAAPFEPAAPAAVAATFSAALFFGALTLQWPVGWLSDRVDRRLVAATLTACAAMCSLVLALAPVATPVGLVVVVLGGWGACAMTTYGVMAAHAADRADKGDVALVLAGMLVMWGVGSVFGPLGAGALMAVGLGPSGLFVFAAFILALTSAALLHRRAQADAVRDEDKAPFSPITNTSMAAAELDPRTERDDAAVYEDVNAFGPGPGSGSGAGSPDDE